MSSESSHCKLQCGDCIGTLSQYTVDKQLGQGRFSTVWAAHDAKGCPFAIKVYRRDPSLSKYYQNEVKILNLVTAEQCSAIIPYYGTFVHVKIGADLAPRVYPCVVLHSAGDHLGRLLRHFRHEYDKGLPIRVVKKFMREILGGIAAIHNLGLIHTDIKPENILMNRGVLEADEDLDGTRLYIGDLGSSTRADYLFSYNVGTKCYVAPEIIVRLNYTNAIDVWSAFVVCYELITGDLLFDLYRECGIEYGGDIECDLLGSEASELSTCTERVKNFADDSLDKSANSTSTSEESESRTNYSHLLIIEKILGPAPRGFVQNGREYYNSRGKLKNNPNITHITISQLLLMNYHLEPEECDEIEDFLLCGLRYMPEDRITAAEALRHPWLCEPQKN